LAAPACRFPRCEQRLRVAVGHESASLCAQHRQLLVGDLDEFRRLLEESPHRILLDAPATRRPNGPRPVDGVRVVHSLLHHMSGHSTSWNGRRGSVPIGLPRIGGRVRTYSTASEPDEAGHHPRRVNARVRYPEVSRGRRTAPLAALTRRAQPDTPSTRSEATRFRGDSHSLQSVCGRSATPNRSNAATCVCGVALIGPTVDVPRRSAAPGRVALAEADLRDFADH
jgi:hypothetical protein